MAHYLRDENSDVKSVYAYINCSLNGATSQPFLNSSVDFSVVEAGDSYLHVLEQKYFL